MPWATVDAADLSEDALSVTRKNAEYLKAQIGLYQGDLWQAVEGRTYDVIVSNPPYIPADECKVLQPEVLQEPLMALDGGSDGLDFYRRIAAGAKDHLREGGMLWLEFGIGEEEAVAALLEKNGLKEVTIYPDLNGIQRMASAVC